MTAPLNHNCACPGDVLAMYIQLSIF